MTEDIRDKPYLTQEDVLGLNFIKAPCPYVFRRHYRAGLRSHIMAILDPQDVKREREGVIVSGLRSFPKARPIKMLRIFRTRFDGLGHAGEEARRVKILERYLGPRHLARSEEFIADYRLEGRGDLLLCGLQEYVAGRILNPWRSLEPDDLASVLRRMDSNAGSDPGPWLRAVRRETESLLERLKRMIREASHVPDLAGVGNLILTRTGNIRLVDINNVSRVSLDPAIPLDDRGYPVCDRSVEALSLLEQKLLDRAPNPEDPVYRVFLDPERMKEVRALEEVFHLALNRETGYPKSS